MSSSHRYPRTARLNELLHQIIAEEIERIDDERLDLVTVMKVEVEPDLRHATVYVDTPTGPERDEEMLEGLADCRVALQAAIGRQARIKRTPTLTFRPDTVERLAARVEDVLRGLHEFGDDDEPDA
jgi:ribosome-binding factor A